MEILNFFGYHCDKIFEGNQFFKTHIAVHGDITFLYYQYDKILEGNHVWKHMGSMSSLWHLWRVIPDCDYDENPHSQTSDLFMVEIMI